MQGAEFCHRKYKADELYLRGLFLKPLILAILFIFSVLGLDATAANPNANKEIYKISCSASGKNSGFYSTQVYVNLERVNFEAGTVSTYSATIVNNGGLEYDTYPTMETAALSGRDLKTVPYNGRKYPNHIKLPLLAAKTATAGDFVPETADLILAPHYTVVKTIPQQNHWDKTWTWDLEVRKHSAVLATNFNDHHGDYIPLECYSTAMVNDSRGKN